MVGLPDPGSGSPHDVLNRYDQGWLDMTRFAEFRLPMSRAFQAGGVNPA